MVSVASSKYFSAACTSSGEVWTFGACFNGALGTNATWMTQPTRVAGQLADAIAGAGGAQKVAAGATFTACLTAQGTVVVWGTLGGSSAQGRTPGAGGASAAAERVLNVPAITDIVAGHQHLLLTDGERVWCVGRWVDEHGAEVGSATWHEPSQALDLGAEGGVAKIVAGSHSSAVIGNNGRVSHAMHEQMW